MAPFARGKIHHLPDIDRQHVLFEERSDDVRQHVHSLYRNLGNAKGGLIGCVSMEPEMPLANIQALLETVSTFTTTMPP